MKKKIIAAGIGVVLILTLLSAAVHKEKILVVEDRQSGVYDEYVLANREFVLGYIHSVLLTPADEYFVITDDNQLLLQKTIYESFGVGLPYEQIQDSDFEIVDGKFILYLDRKIKELNMVISPIPKHSLTVNGEKIELIDLLNENTQSIKIYAIEKNVFEIGNYHFIL